MAYPPPVRQDGFQLPSPAHTASPKSTPDDDRDEQLFMPHNISFLPDPLRRFPAQAQTHHHQQPIDFADELATLIETPHVPSHERSTHSRSPNDDTYRHNIFDISAPAPAQQQPHQDIYQHDYAHFNSTLPALNSSMRYDPHPDPSAGFQYRHSPSPHRSRSRSPAPSVGPTRSTRRDRRASTISHVSSTSSPPRPHPHAIVIPGRGNPMAGFFVPNGTSAPPDYNLPTPDSLSHSFGLQHAHAHTHAHAQYPYPAQTPSSPYYPYPSVNRAGTPSMGISPTDVEALNNISINGIAAHHIASSLPASHVTSLSKPVASASSTSTAKQLDPDTHLSEKRRRRRESHNAVERRRRDNINERIGELASLIPGVLFECDGPLVVPGTTPPAGSAPGPNLAEDLFTIGVLGDSVGMHVLPAEEGLPDLPEEESMVKKDPSEEGEVLAPTSPTSVSAPNGNPNGLIASGASNEQTTIKANKGMILRKSVDYIRYLQQLVSVQASRGRDLEERNRLLERELVVARGDVAPPSSASSASSASPSVASSVVLSMSSSNASASSKPSSLVDSIGGVERCGESVEDLEMDDIESEAGERSRGEDSRGRRFARLRDKAHMHPLGLGEASMEI